MADIEQIIIVGSGPAGYTAALYTARANLSPLVIEGFLWGGLLQQTTDVENYPGFRDGIMGPELMQSMRDQAERFGARFITDNATKIELGEHEGDPHTVWIGDEEQHKARAIVLAMGAEHKKLGVAGEEELANGRGVSYCATCDAAFFKARDTVGVGGGDSAMEEANFLSRFGDVTLVHRRDHFRASKIMLDRAHHNPKVRLMTNTVVEEIYDPEEKLVRGVRLRNIVEDRAWDEPVDGFFVAIGHIPNTAVFKGQIETDSDGYIVSMGGARTNIPGVFHAGDVQDRTYRQAITASGAGCMAAIEVERFLEAEGH